MRKEDWLMFLGALFDISDRKEMEESLNKSRRDMNTWIQNLPICTMVLDMDLNLQFMSDAGIEQLKIDDINSYYGNPYPLHFFPVECKNQMINKLQEVLESGKIAEIESKLCDTQGNKRWYHHTLVPVFEPESILEYILVVSVDITGRRLAERELNQSLTKYKLLFEALPIGITVSDKMGKIVEVNRIAEKILGIETREHTKRTLDGKEWKIVQPDGKSMPAEKYASVRALKENTLVSDVEMGIVKGDGEITWINVSAIPVPLGDLGVLVAYNDISESKKAREELLSTQADIRSLLENSGMSFVLIDNDMNIRAFNEQANQNSEFFYGKSLKKGRSILEYTIKGTETGFKNCFHKCLKGEKSKVDLGVPPDNPDSWLRFSFGPVKDENEEVTGVLLSTTNITDQKTAEIRLLENQYYLSKAQEIGKIGTWELDLLKNELIWTEQNYKNFGVAPGTPLTYELFLDCVHPEDRDYVNSEWGKAIQGNPYDIEHRVLVEGKIRWLREKADVTFDNEGNPLKAIGFTQDITEKILYEEKLVEAKEKAEKSDRLKTAFLSNMSHEIRTPMNGILGFAGLLSKPDLSGSKQKKYIKIIEQSGERMLTIINDIVDISKIESGTMEVYLSLVNINQQLEYLINFFRPEAENKGLEIKLISALNDEIAEAYTDGDKLTAILINLIKNALKFTEKGFVHFGCEFVRHNSQHYLQFFVKDSGIGISKEKQSVVFERFIQDDAQGKADNRGSGLGLAISKAYAEMLGGEIWLESQKAKGSVFYFRIPYARNKNEK